MSMPDPGVASLAEQSAADLSILSIENPLLAAKINADLATYGGGPQTLADLRQAGNLGVSTIAWLAQQGGG